MVSWVDPIGFAPPTGKSLFEDSGAGSSTGARDAIGNTQIHWDHTRNGKKEFTCFSLPEPLRSHFLRFLSTCKNRIIITFKWNSCSSPCESPSARNSSFTVVFEESGVCWPLSKAHPCWICPRATWTNESFILDIFIPVLRRSCASFHFLTVLFHLSLDVMWMCPWSRSRQLALGPSKTTHQGPKGVFQKHHRQFPSLFKD